MSRAKTRLSSETCADCSAAEPGWASVNRGVLVCDECCSVHRSLGRHISQIKSMKKGLWNPSMLTMIHQLVSSGANSIWEHSLLDPSQSKQGRRKPNPRDPVHPVKADFIRAKYQFLAFVNKHKDGEVGSQDDLSKQLHSSVRTANLEVSLKLLSLGADPNYFHPEKGNMPLHIAAQSGQSSQVELLIVYGSDPGAFDSNGKTPADYAKAEGHTDLSDRIVECQYEVTDRLAFYLCGRKPDHRAGQHFIIPEMSDSSLDLSELAKAAKKKLQALPNHLFEELAMDVYDEVDRRENDTIWLSAQSNSSMLTDRQTVPFLPVNPDFSSTRNQGRQKLARFNAREFATLIIDILCDARRRQCGISTPVQSPTPSKDSKESLNKTSETPATKNVQRRLQKTSSLSDDEPLYDSVASDEDYSSIGDVHSFKDTNDSKKSSVQSELLQDTPDKYSVVIPEVKVEYHSNKRSVTPTSMISFTENMFCGEHKEGTMPLEEYLEVKKSLADSQKKVNQLTQMNKDLRQEVSLLTNMVQKLMQENQGLRTGHIPVTVTQKAQTLPNGHEGQRLGPGAEGGVVMRSRGSDRPQSMFEPRDQSRKVGQEFSAPTKEDLTTTTELPGSIKTDTHQTTAVSTTSLHLRLDHKVTSSGDCDYDNPPDRQSSSSHSSGRSESSQQTPTADDYKQVITERVMPTQDEVVKKTEKITKKIQELLMSAQEGKIDRFTPCADKIIGAVKDMASIFPQTPKSEELRVALQLLRDGATKLREQCSSDPNDTQTDYRLKTQQVIQCAYEIAKAAKQLVSMFE